MPKYKLIQSIKEADAELRKCGYEFDDMVANHVMATLIYKFIKKDVNKQKFVSGADMKMRSIVSYLLHKFVRMICI